MNRMDTGNTNMKTSALPTKFDQTKLACVVDTGGFKWVVPNSFHGFAARNRPARLCGVRDTPRL